MKNYSDRAIQREHHITSQHWPSEMAPVPEAQWARYQRKPDKVWRSREFVAKLIRDLQGHERLCVSRAYRGAELGWNELQRVKRECGFGDRWAVECFPADTDEMKASSFRHLWLLPEPPRFGWRARAKQPGGTQ